MICVYIGRPISFAIFRLWVCGLEFEWMLSENIIASGTLKIVRYLAQPLHCGLSNKIPKKFSFETLRYDRCLVCP